VTDPNEIEIQKRYYAETATQYDSIHLDESDEHFFALSFLVGAIDYLKFRSIFDIGSGTGRAIRYIKSHHPEVRVVGIEPQKELRQIGYSQGFSENDLLDGKATKLYYDASDFDLVCEFGVLHHIRNPELAVSEMLRVAGIAVFISDSNNFGQGSIAARLLKQAIYFIGLWKIADLIKTRGKGYTISNGDGLTYSYSVFDNYKQIRAQCRSVHLLNTRDGHINPFTTASHVALLGI
jgi:SAM-dependent methyltransferase